MNKVFIVGNLTRDPELRTTHDGTPVCSFSVAVNRRQTAKAGQPEADYFRVTAWRGLGETCSKYLAKGRKVSVTGAVSVSTYTASDGSTRASLEVTADDVEFLTPKGETESAPAAPAKAPAPRSNDGGYIEVSEDAELPF